MSNEGFKGFKPTEVSLSPKLPEKKEAANDQGLAGFTADEMKYLSARIFNHMPPWADDVNDPVYQNMPDDLESLLKAAAAPTWDIALRKEIIQKLEDRWDELDARS